MLRLDTTTRKLQAQVSGIVATNQLPINVSWSDQTSTTYNGGSTVVNTNNTTAVDICAAPAASTYRDVDYVNIYNADTVAETVTIIYNDNSTLYNLLVTTLNSGDRLIYTHGSGWQTIDSAGNYKTILVTSYAGQTTVPSNNQTGTTYTFALSDAGKFCTFSNASAQTVTVPPNSSVAFPVDTQIEVCQLGAGKVTLAQGAGVTIYSQGSNKSLAAQYAGAILQKTGTDTWVLIGNLTI